MRITNAWRVVIVFSAGVALAAVTAGQTAKPSGGGNAQLIDDLVVANRILANENILDGLGHVSVRSLQRPDHFFMARFTRRGRTSTPSCIRTCRRCCRIPM